MGTQFAHLRGTQGWHGADPQAAGDHAPDRRQLVTFKGHRQAGLARLQVLFEHHPHRRRTLQGNEGLLQQGVPVDFAETGQRRITGHHRDKTVDIERRELQR
ncbi:hypothetical protein D3C81_1967440 [compost metagenome]